MAASHMIGNNLQSPEAAADLSHTVLSEKFRSRFRAKLHCPLNPHNDWLRAQSAGIDILMSGDSKYSSACFRDAFHMYFNGLKKKQTDEWRAQAAQHAHKMTSMWKTFSDKVTELKMKGDKLIGPHGVVSDTQAKHSTLELMHKLKQGARDPERALAATAPGQATSSGDDSVENPAPALKPPVHTLGGSTVLPAKSTRVPSTGGTLVSLRALRGRQEKSSDKRHQRFEAFKQQHLSEANTEAFKHSTQVAAAPEAFRRGASPKPGHFSAVSGTDKNTRLSTDDFSIEDQFEMLRQSSAVNSAPTASMGHKQAVQSS